MTHFMYNADPQFETVFEEELKELAENRLSNSVPLRHAYDDEYTSFFDLGLQDDIHRIQSHFMQQLKLRKNQMRCVDVNNDSSSMISLSAVLVDIWRATVHCNIPQPVIHWAQFVALAREFINTIHHHTCLPNALQQSAIINAIYLQKADFDISAFIDFFTYSIFVEYLLCYDGDQRWEAIHQNIVSEEHLCRISRIVLACYRQWSVLDDVV